MKKPDARTVWRLSVDAFEIGNAGQLEAQVVGWMLGMSLEFARTGNLEQEACALVAKVVPAMQAAHTTTRLWGLDAAGVAALRAFQAVFEQQLGLATPEQVALAQGAVGYNTAAAAQLAAARAGATRQ
jgi:hypothetical protein